MSRTLPSLAALLLLARCLAPAPASAADAPRPLAKLAGPAGTAVEFSRDGKLILTAGGDEARVWDAKTFEPVTPPIKPQSHVASAALSPDSSRVVTASGTDAELWSAASGKQLLEPLRHPDQVTRATFSDDGRFLATTAADGLARVWDVQTGKQMWAFRHDRKVYRAVFAPGGGRLLTSVDPYGSFLWDLTSGKKLAEFAGDTRGFGTPAVFSPDGGRVVTAEWHWANVWDAATGRKLQRLVGLDPEPREPLGAGQVNCVAFTPDGSKIIVAGMGGARLFNARDGGLLDVEFLSAFVENTATSSDGTKLFCADSSYLSKVWDLNTGEELLAVDVGRGARSAPAVAFSPDGRRVAAGFASDGHTAVWEVPEGKQP